MQQGHILSSSKLLAVFACVLGITFDYLVCFPYSANTD